MSTDSLAAHSPSTPLPWSQKIGYGSGDFAFNLYWQGISLYLFYFYTDVLGLPNVLAGMIYAIGSLWDAVTDPAMGYVAERTRSRWGRYRPYLLFTPIPLAMSYLLLFWSPNTTSIPLLVTMALGAQLIFRAVFTIGSTPYSSLMARMTRSSKDRAGMAGARMVFAYFGSFTVVILAGYLLEIADNDRQGFLYLAMISGLLASLVLWACFAICKEPAENPSQDAAPLTLKTTYHSMRQNTPFLIAFAAILTMVTGATVISKTALYVFEYEMGNRAAGNMAMVYFTLFGFIAIPFWTWVTLKTSKRFVWMAGSGVTTLGLLALWFNPAHSVEQMQLNYLVISLGVGAYGVTFWGMVPDTVEYGEWRTGVRVESMIFGSITFAQKAAVAMSAIILGLLLDAIGYQAGAVQSAETITGLRAVVVFVPLAGVLVSVAIMYFYPLSPQRHAEIVADIETREAP